MNHGVKILVSIVGLLLLVGLIGADSSVRVPFGEVEETFVARFDPQAGMLRFLEAMHYKEATDERKTFWINEAREWRDIAGNRVTAVCTTSWFDEGTPWAVWAPEEVVYNADVRQYIRAAGQ